MILAVVPAAGHSVRMGRPKLSLPLGDRTVLEWVIKALRTGGVEYVLVVVGPHVGELRPLAESAGAAVLTLPEETPDMRATVQHGLDWMEKNYHPHDDDSWLLVPADHPTLDAAVIRQLLDARQEHPETSIVIPTHQGKRGHPAVIAWKHVAGIRALPPRRGLNAYLREHAGDTLELPVASPHVLCDLDTPEDYERLRSAVKNSGGDSFLA
jgi:molybdenum cofactor cytidylyltransferase